MLISDISLKWVEADEWSGSFCVFRGAFLVRRFSYYSVECMGKALLCARVFMNRYGELERVRLGWAKWESDRAGADGRGEI